MIKSTFNRSEALEKAIHGKAMRGVTWPPGTWFIYDRDVVCGNPFRYKPFASNDLEELKNLFESENTEFEIYHPLKKKVDMWLFCYRPTRGEHGVVIKSDRFFKDSEDAVNCLGETAQRLEWSKTPIEVDE